MMKRFIPIALLCCVFLLQACKKEEEPAPTGTTGDEKESVIEIKTAFGNMYMWLYKETPKHRDNFLKLAGEGFFDSTTFHRIIQNFMIQGGDPYSKDAIPGNDGTGGPGYTIPAEILSSFNHVRGSVGTARQANNVNPERASSGSQFFINVNNNTNLNGEYTVFATIMKGMEVADKIVIQAKDGNDRPTTNIRMDVNILKKTKAEIKSEYGYTVN